ncbi:SDR family NAD(P)-dependent oxidoreductase [Actinoplanes sp. NPDC049265]|uniref:SDR family NAD(P)-dependent oxidoreductase n=1 Tax=Actinoplanes sp. NPDC049265 TaxID=3363902 RepID=UPI00371A37C0
MKPFVFRGKTAVLTGAASGIGEQLAYGLAQRGCDLVLVDKDAVGLKAVAGRINGAVRTHVADLSDPSAATELGRLLRERHPRLGLLVNNAGMALGGLFEQVTIEEFETVLNVNLRAPVRLTHELLPSLLASEGSHLVNVSSLYGLIAPAGQAAYSTSKFGLRGFSEVLRSELDGRVGVTTIHPGGIRTRIAANAPVGSNVPKGGEDGEQERFDRLLSYPPEKAAAEILDGVARRRARVLIASSAKVPAALSRLMPVSHMKVIGRLVRLASR